MAHSVDGLQEDYAGTYLWCLRGWLLSLRLLDWWFSFNLLREIEKAYRSNVHTYVRTLYAAIVSFQMRFCVLRYDIDETTQGLRPLLLSCLQDNFKRAFKLIPVRFSLSVLLLKKDPSKDTPLWKEPLSTTHKLTLFHSPQHLLSSLCDTTY